MEKVIEVEKIIEIVKKNPKEAIVMVFLSLTLAYAAIRAGSNRIVSADEAVLTPQLSLPIIAESHPLRETSIPDPRFTPAPVYTPTRRE